MKYRSLNQWLEYLEHRHTQTIQLGLQRVYEAASRLDLLKPNCKVITVAGTNGKGSTVAALEHIYHTIGQQVGAYTSPHILHFNERIRLNLKSIPDEALCLAFDFIESITSDLALTYFEITTLAALFYFKQHSLDVIILEVGLGGRLDATNIIDADLSIITTIDYDHQDFLGHTLDAIGYEKAGILRKGKPFVYADSYPPSSIVNVAEGLEAPSYYYGKDFSFELKGNHWDFLGLNGLIIKELPLPKIGLKSAAAALLAFQILNFDQNPCVLELIQAMQSVYVPGRLQWEEGDVSVLYDVSHNPQSAQLLAETIKPFKGKIHAVFSALKDKDLSGLVSPLKDIVDFWYPSIIMHPRAASQENMMSTFKNAEIHVNICYNSPFIAFKEALNQAELGDLIVVFGSFFTVAQVWVAQGRS